METKIPFTFQLFFWGLIRLLCNEEMSFWTIKKQSRLPNKALKCICPFWWGDNFKVGSLCPVGVFVIFVSVVSACYWIVFSSELWDWRSVRCLVNMFSKSCHRWESDPVCRKEETWFSQPAVGEKLIFPVQVVTAGWESFFSTDKSCLSSMCGSRFPSEVSENCYTFEYILFYFYFLFLFFFSFLTPTHFHQTTMFGIVDISPTISNTSTDLWCGDMLTQV